MRQNVTVNPGPCVEAVKQKSFGLADAATI
jgi:hypothetical protein